MLNRDFNLLLEILQVEGEGMLRATPHPPPDTCQPGRAGQPDTLTILTDACRNALFSSCRLFTRSLYVSSSALRTRFCCCKQSILFCHCSLVMGEGGMDGGCMVGPSVTEDESLSLALSAMFTLRPWLVPLLHKKKIRFEKGMKTITEEEFIRRKAFDYTVSESTLPSPPLTCDFLHNEGPSTDESQIRHVT
ncbi:hypothetical protein E2C01_002929 [Portunus trituberculatus]|uniref:Uncharacterized protein n=1 Tax=Portunus trituberculatus TaxID=210409 RepID=A0A5B7CM28_PORTR|nr:hypothetical protein [Portunus trituberculatus]